MATTMMIEISEKTLQRLQNIRRHDETIELVVRRLLDAVEKESLPINIKHKKVKNSLNSPKIGLSHPHFDAEQFDKDHEKNIKLDRTFLENSWEERVTYPYGALPSLTHTICKCITVNNEELEKPNWLSAVRAIFQEIGSSNIETPHFHGLQVVDGKRNDSGFNYIPEIDKSVQGADANQTARAIFDMAEEYQIPIKIYFQWKKNGKVKYPGRHGVIAFPS
jgi:hypothetical protein